MPQPSEAERASLSWPARSFIALCAMAVFYRGFEVIPFALTLELYDANSEIHEHFPIAIIDKGNPSAVKWREYKKDPNQFRNKLLVEAGAHQIGSFESFLLSRHSSVSFYLLLKAEDHHFTSRYEVRNGLVLPLSFHSTGAWALVPALLAMGLSIPLMKRLVRRVIGKR
jgi:hypothetical protein